MQNCFRKTQNICITVPVINRIYAKTVPVKQNICITVPVINRIYAKNVPVKQNI